jgi:hypothetical protein
MANRNWTTACLITEQDDNGTVPYAVAAFACRVLALAADFAAEYGPAARWVDPETGAATGIDVGELLAWVDKTLG